MKTTLALATLLGASATLATPASAPLGKSDYIRIEIGDGDDGDDAGAAGAAGSADRGRHHGGRLDHHGSGDDRSERELRRRVRQLERAVVQLQDQVYFLSQRLDASAGSGGASAGGPRHVCSITTPFHGTHVGTATTKLEAMAIALKACEAGGAPFCDEHHVKCEKEG
jgi:hypothetical protein